MRYRVAFLLMLAAAALVAGEKKAERAQPAAKPGGLPAGAVSIGPDAYRQVDAQGKAWISRRTPFGWMRAEEKAEKATPAKPAAVETKVVEQGDNVRFERMTPFGAARWVRRKSELTDQERRIWEQASEAKSAAKTGSKE